VSLEKILEKIAEAETKRPKTILAIFIAFTILMLLGFGNIEFDTDFENQVPQEIEEIVALNEIRDKLGGATDSIVIIFRTDFEDPYSLYDMRNRELLKSIKLITTQLEDDDFVLSTRSISEMIDLDSSQNEINEMIDMNPLTESMLSSDYSLTTATITVANGITREQQEELLDKIENTVLYTEIPAGIKVSFAGSIVLSRELGKSIGSSTGLVTILGFVGVFIVLFIFFRRFSFVLITAIPIILGILWTFGTLSYVGIPLSTQLTGVFSIIIGLGIDFGIHIIHRFKEDSKKYGPNRAIYNSVKNIGKGITLTSITTIIGFLALLAAALPLLRDFSIALSLGVFYCLVAAIAVIPPVLVIIERRRIRKKRKAKK
jgi:hydrophobe/amphiphile efflux-3 (HAE3) family protein